MSIGVAHDDGNGNWLDLAGTGTANYTGSITSTNISSFKSKFTIGYPPGALPVELVNFSAKKSGAQVLCEWLTASEINNDYFTVERSANGSDFDSIASVKGAGNSTSLLNYKMMDANPLTGDSYYRLKQTDFDGSSVYFEAVHVSFNPDSRYTVFPNPTPGNFVFINKNGADMSDARIVVHDLSGKEVESSMKFSGDKKEIQLSIDPSSGLKNNFYILSVVSGGEAIEEKVLVDKR